MLGIGAGHKLGVGLNWSTGHHNKARFKVVANFSAVATLSAVVRGDENIHPL